jgi:hypothetical protein
MHNEFTGYVDNAFISIKGTTLMLNGSQQFKLSKTLTGEISGFMRTPGVEGVIKIKTFGMVNIGLSKQVLNNKGSIRLNVRDFLNIQKFRGESKYGNVDASFQEKHDSRVINFGFSYRFGKGKINPVPKRNTGGASDEQSRVNGGHGN